MSEQTQQMEKVTQSLIQACEDINAACCKSMDTMMESTSAVTKGCEEWSHKLGNLMQESVTRAMSTGKTMLTAKSMKEVADLQAGFVKEFFDSWMAATNHLTEISTRATQEAFEPVNKQANAAMGKVVQAVQQVKSA